MKPGDLIVSIILHLAVILAFVISSPFKPKVNTDLGDVVRVRLTGMPAPQQEAPPKEIKPVELPSPIDAEEPVVPVMEMASVNKAAVIEKPKPKPKPKKKEEYHSQAEKGKEERAGKEGGTKDVSKDLGAGSKFGGATIDNASFTYPYWFDQAFSKIERNWTNPVYANTKLQCTIYFQVIRSGRIIKIEVKESSGIPAYDQACERAVELSQPLPPLPDSFTEEIIGISLVFPYEPG